MTEGVNLGLRILVRSFHGRLDFGLKNGGIPKRIIALDLPMGLLYHCNNIVATYIGGSKYDKDADQTWQQPGSGD